MKKLILIILVLTLRTTADAQRIRQGALHSEDNPRNEWLLPGDTIYNTDEYGCRPMIYNGKPRLLSVADSVRITPPSYNYPYARSLHQGLNLSMDLSAFATFGKNLPHRGGFGQTIDAAYLAPLTRDGKLWGAGGIYFNNTTWGGDSYRDIGLYAMLGYRFNEKWEMYLYGQLSVDNNYNSLYGRYLSPYRAYYPWSPFNYTMRTGYGFATPGANIIGIGAKYNVSPSFSVQVNVQAEWYDTHRFEYRDHHEYPLQKP